MLKCYTPEMDEKEPTTIEVKKRGNLALIKIIPIEISAMRGHYGGWYVRTKQQLKGRGIRQTDEETYRLTDLAFEKLQAINDIKMRCLLD